MWQKERLLNLALAALPPSCRKVVWLDCDLIFEAPDWPGRTSELVDRFALVQPFAHVHRAPRDWRPGEPLDALGVLDAFGHIVETRMSIEDCLWSLGEDARCARGMAWAARRDLLERHGLYDRCVVGGGDAALLRSAFGLADLAAGRLHMNGAATGHFLDWARPFHDAVRGSVGYVPGDVVHLWHGDLPNRRYQQRFADFGAFGFDPVGDIATDENGAWRWGSEKPEMHDFVRRYFADRREDG
jgi:hypothetical protein